MEKVPALVNLSHSKTFVVSYPTTVMPVAVMVQLFNVANMELIAGKDLLELFVKVFGDVLKGCAKRYRA